MPGVSDVGFCSRLLVSFGTSGHLTPAKNFGGSKFRVAGFGRT